MRSGGLVLLLAVFSALGGCASTSSTTAAGVTTSPGDTTTSAAAHSAASRPRSGPRHGPGPARATPRSAGGLPLSSVSADVVQPQPAPGTCHARGQGQYAMPDPHCTPGAVNPAVTPDRINRTICVGGWTKTVRPPESVSEREKRLSMAAYGDVGSPRDYEYDHLVSLELGGAVNDSRNLWPEPGGSQNPKDAVEDQLHRLVCGGQMTLSRAQQIIATGWAAWAHAHPAGITTSAAAAPAGPPRQQSPGQPSRPPSPSGGPDIPISDINCSDFPTHAAAQQWFEAHGGSPTNDVAGLDRNHDGQACTSLP